MLGVGRDDLVALSDAEPVEDDVAALRRRSCQGDRALRGSEEAGERRPEILAAGEHRIEVLATRAPLFQVAGERCLHRLDSSPRQRPVRARIEVGGPLEDRKPGANGV